MDLGICFVIQPFDKGKFDARYADVFAPAIEACGLSPYRVDRDPGVDIPIDDIEQGIRNSRLCLAEITLDNPNVWFELGYALACDKQVVLVCSSERDQTKSFPFDVRHRNIILYDTHSSSSFIKLEKDIVARIQALLKKAPLVLDQVSSDLSVVNNLMPHEIDALITIMVNSIGAEGISVYELKKEMSKNGFNDGAISVAITKLLRKRMIEHDTAEDYNGNSFMVYRVTELGEDWVIDNEDLFVLQRKTKKDEPHDPFVDISDEDLPF